MNDLLPMNSREKKKPTENPFKKTQFPGRTTIQRIFQYAEFRNWINFMEIFFSFWFLSFDFDQDNFHFDVKHFSFWLLLKSHKFIYFFSPNSAVAPSTLHAHRISIWIFSRIRMRQCTQTIWFFSTEWQQFHFCSFKEKKQHTKLFFGFSPLVFILLYRNILHINTLSNQKILLKLLNKSKIVD